MSKEQEKNACDWLENLEGDAWADACEEIDGAVKRQAEGAQWERNSLRSALEQAYMALIGYLPAHRNAVTNAAIEASRAALALPSLAPELERPEEWRPMDTAPKNGSIIRLLVNFEDMSIDDGDGPFATIGQNNFANDGEDLWQVVGWCWEHDHFTDGKGTPIGWLPMLYAAPVAPVAQAGQVPKELREAVEWADHLLFECGALVQTRAPSVHVYNKAFAAIEAAKTLLASASAQGGE